jgi:hypothetical protein
VVVWSLRLSNLTTRPRDEGRFLYQGYVPLVVPKGYIWIHTLHYTHVYTKQQKALEVHG